MTVHHGFPVAPKALQAALKSPFPWFGGKSRAADEVWQRLGRAGSYYEPFAGSLAVLLNAPGPAALETINDKDAHVCNFWRALRADPMRLAQLVDWPVLEPDLWARRAALTEGRAGLAELLAADARRYDVEMAAWWLWTICVSIAPQVRPDKAKPGTTAKGAASRAWSLPEVIRWFDWLSVRLRGTRVLCGDWQRAVTDCELAAGKAPRVVFLDPPYDAGTGYAEGDHSVSAAVRAWAIERTGSDLRMALCGGAGEHAMPAGWTCYRWRRVGGFASRRPLDRRKEQGEEIWFSPACVSA